MLGIIAFVFVISIVGFASAAADENGGFLSWLRSLFGFNDAKNDAKYSPSVTDRAAPTNGTNITCYSSAQCPPPVNNSYCYNNQPCSGFTYYNCVNPGTPQSYCMNVSGGGCGPVCNYGCSNGQCNQNNTNQTHLACVNQACVAVAGGGANLCTSNSQCQNSTNQTHLACVNQACVIVSGGGSNLCTTNANCQNSTNQTHLACVGNTCAIVNGSGTNQCSPAGSSCGNSSLPTKRVFVTSFNVPSPNFVNISVVDGYCSQAKNQAGLGGAWRAWISFSNLNAGTRVIDAKYIRVGDSVKVADNKADLLDGSLDAPINRNQFGNVTSNIVMTGTNKNGNVLSGKNCNNWQSSSANYTGAIGSSSLANGNWTNSGTYNCNNLVNSARIYCFEI